MSVDSSTNRPKRVYRGTLKKTHELEKLFKILDARTLRGKGFEGNDKLPYTQRKYNTYGMFAEIKEAIGGDRKTILSRIADHPYGSKAIERRGTSSAKELAWSQTACYQAIKQHPECWDGKKGEFTEKGKKYEADLKRIWEMEYSTPYARLSKGTDPLDMDLNQWLMFWGNPAKSVGTAHLKFTDPMTGRVRYSAAVSFRFAMRRSHASDIQQLIITEDGRFNTEMLKRPKGLHKEEFQNEEQIKALPEFLQNIEILMLDYMGIMFGGRFDALKELTPADVKREFHQIHFYEGKVDLDVDKPIFEPETSFIWRYITDKRLAKNQKLFPRSLTDYNRQLTAAGIAMGQKYPALRLLNDKNQEWNLTTHRGFKHTCISNMALHGVRRDVISDYVGTDEATIKEFYQGGAEENIKHEIGGEAVKQKEPTWRAFVIAFTKVFEARYNQLIAQERMRA
jgi:hypothetical protein